jgi:hypothetical protein
MSHNMSGDSNEDLETLDRADEPLVEELRRAANRFDPPPPPVLEAARASLSWRTIDAELAELTFDSIIDQPATQLRGGEGPRLMTFAAPGLDIEVEVSRVGPRRQLVGQVVPTQTAHIEVHHGGGIETVEADRLGRFSAEAISAGPVRLRCHLDTTPTTRRIVTQWISL